MNTVSSGTTKCSCCDKIVQNQDFAPFCSKACKDRDLLKWLGEGYALPGPMVEPEDAE